MPSTYKTPGVYIEEISKFPPSVAEVETAIPAFIGYTQQAKVRGVDYQALMAAEKTAKQKALTDAQAELTAAGADDTKKAAAQTKVDEAQAALTKAPDVKPVAVRITSLLEYEQFFGTAELETSITVTVTAEGVVNANIAKPSSHNMYYSLQAYFANGGGPCYIVSVGKATGTIVKTDLDPGLAAVEKEDEVTLIVFPEILSLEIADSKALYDAALAQAAKLQDRFVVMDAKLDDPSLSVFAAAAKFRDDGISTNNLKYGAAYGPRVATIFDYAFEDPDVSVTFLKPKNADGSTPDPETVKMNTIDPKEASDKGQFYPLVKSAIASLPVVLPAAPLVVGVYASVDSTRGVWKAPANVSLSSVVGPTIKITNEDQENLNLDTTGKAINAIRAFTGKGTLIWGARTLAGNDNEWRYVPVRRFFNMAEESIKKATEGFVFEPNDANTWTKVRAMIENFLTLQWRAGALQGAKPEQSFYVKVGLNETMTALDILEGRMIIEIGMAVVRPAEFIILKFSHKMAES